MNEVSDAAQTPSLLLRLAYAMGVLLICVGACYLVAPQIFRFVLDHVRGTLVGLDAISEQAGFSFLSPGSYLTTMIGLSWLLGFGLALPVISYQLWHILPGHRRADQAKPALIFSLIVTMAYGVGLAIGYWQFGPAVVAYFAQSVLGLDVTGEVAEIFQDSLLNQAYEVNMHILRSTSFIMALLAGFVMWIILRRRGWS